MQIKRTFFVTAVLLLAILMLGGCKSISEFDQYAYVQGTALKVDALSIMSKATETFASQQTNIEEVIIRIDKAYEYEKHRPQNGITLKMWEILRNPDRNLFGGFIKRWKEKSTLSAPFINEASIQVGEAFDMIAELESHKIKPTDEKV